MGYRETPGSLTSWSVQLRRMAQAIARPASASAPALSVQLTERRFPMDDLGSSLGTVHCRWSGVPEWRPAHTAPRCGRGY